MCVILKLHTKVLTQFTDKHNKMKKLIFALFICAIANGQDCKYAVDKIDEFTKDKILELKETQFSNYKYSSGYTLKKVNDNRYIVFSIRNSDVFSLPKDNRLMLKTETDVIELFFPKTIVAEGNQFVWYAYISIPINDNVYQKLLIDKLNKIRVYATSGYFEFEVKAKNALKFQENLKCIE